ncbi:MAG: hypothetical protein LBR85_01345 [Oscillospiraceae bacterium]|jgi:hypothetical protein|nr:hypothetical protein [Oscillospiraceae bacterium]
MPKNKSNHNEEREIQYYGINEFIQKRRRSRISELFEKRRKQRRLTWGSGASAGGGGRVLTAAGVIISVITLAVIAGALFSQPYSVGASAVTASTVRRAALASDLTAETPYYSDFLGLIDDEDTLIRGMRVFFQKTGVQPYLYLSDGAQTAGTALYGQLFADGGHLLVVCSPDGADYSASYFTGGLASGVIDTEAGQILLDYIDRYTKGGADEKAFSNAFDAAGRRIMSVTSSMWVFVWIAAGILAAVIAGLVWWGLAHRRKAG